MEYRVAQIEDHTWRIEEYNESASAYCYLVEGTKTAALIDTGFGTIPLKEVVGSLTSLPIVVLLTHGHADHIGNTGAFDTVYMNRKDVELYKLHETKEVRHFFSSPKDKLYPTKKVDEIKPLEEHMIISLGGRDLRVIETPGHSAGSVCFIDEQSQMLFTGDTCCEADVLMVLDYAATIEEFKNSMDKLLKETFKATWAGHHHVPVDREVLEEFKEAAVMLINGEASGIDAEIGGQKAKRFQWKRIAIVY